MNSEDIYLWVAGNGIQERASLPANRPQPSGICTGKGFSLAIPLAQPLFVIIGKEYTASELSGLGLFVVASGIAALISGSFWGISANRSSRKLLIFLGLFGIINGLLVLGFTHPGSEIRSIYHFAPLVLLNMTAHGGARLSRKT